MHCQFTSRFAHFLGRIACIALMRPIATDDARSVVFLCVCLSVCLCVGHTDVSCKNGWTDRDAVWGLTRVGPRYHVLDGVEIPRREGQFWGVVQPIEKQWESAAVRAAKGIIQSSITSWQSTAMLTTGRCHVTLSPFLAMWPFVKILWPLVLILKHATIYWN